MIGIYILRFRGTDKVYIGQSINIENRFAAHCSKLRRGIGHKKLQIAYGLYGEPQLEVLMECLEEELDTLENEAIDIFNSVDYGFNICATAGGGCKLLGEDAGNSKYSNESIEQSFLLLVNKSGLTTPQISEITKVSKDTIYAISSGKVHLWLKDKYPIEYSILVSNKPTSRFGKGKTLKERGITYPKIISPEGIKYQVDNTSTFAKEHKLNNGHLVQVLKGQEKQHKGWRLE